MTCDMSFDRYVCTCMKEATRATRTIYFKGSRWRRRVFDSGVVFRAGKRRVPCFQGACFVSRVSVLASWVFALSVISWFLFARSQSTSALPPSPTLTTVFPRVSRVSPWSSCVRLLFKDCVLSCIVVCDPAWFLCHCMILCVLAWSCMAFYSPLWSFRVL